jgi:hypothetical protein
MFLRDKKNCRFVVIQKRPEMKLVIQGVLAIAAVVLAWMIYDTIDSKIEFQKIAEKRKHKVVERLKDIRTAQISYKSTKGTYAKNFNQLVDFIKNDSMSYIKAIGTVPDTLTEVKAVEMGIVIRDTFKIAVRDTLFPANYPVDSLAYIPFSNQEQFQMDAGQIEKNKLTVQVFEAFAEYNKIYYGLNLSNENIKAGEGLRVGSMNDPSTTGNWE